MTTDVKFLLVAMIVVGIFVLGVWFTDPERHQDDDRPPTWHKRRPR